MFKTEGTFIHFFTLIKLGILVNIFTVRCRNSDRSLIFKLLAESLVLEKYTYKKCKISGHFFYDLIITLQGVIKITVATHSGNETYFQQHRNFICDVQKTVSNSLVL